MNCVDDDDGVRIVDIVRDETEEIEQECEIQQEREMSQTGSPKKKEKNFFLYTTNLFNLASICLVLNHVPPQILAHSLTIYEEML